MNRIFFRPETRTGKAVLWGGYAATGLGALVTAVSGLEFWAAHITYEGCYASQPSGCVEISPDPHQAHVALEVGSLALAEMLVGMGAVASAATIDRNMISRSFRIDFERETLVPITEEYMNSLPSVPDVVDFE